MAPKKQKLQEAKSAFDSGKQTTDWANIKAHYDSSWTDLVTPNLQGFSDKEALLIGKNLDSISNLETDSSVFDPRLATLSLERCARVMAQNPSGKSLAMSNDDKGKNMLMNLTMDKWVIPNANSQFSFLMKNRMWDLYSLMYGVMFALVDRVETDHYSGADFWILPIRHCRPQPGKFSLAESEWFGVSTWVSKDWLSKRNKNTWHNIDQVLALRTQSQAAGDRSSQERTLIEQERQPSVSKPKAKGEGDIEIYTEYRGDRWVTINPDAPNLILRDIASSHDDDKLPILAKYCFPLMDSIYGLGEFERGKTLQLALNSLWNLYLDGVKMSIFPPIQMVADDIVPSSINLEPAAKWLLTKTGAEIKSFNSSPQGITTFQSTYQFLVGSILNLTGTTDTTVSKSSDVSMGKTPQALKLQASRENSRDSWDRFMMEEALEDLMGKMVNITASGMDKTLELRLFAKDIEEIKKAYPDVVELVDGSERGLVKVEPKEFEDTKFDYQIVSGSTYQADKEQEQQNITSLLNFTIQNFQLLSSELAKQNKGINLAELYQRSLIVSGIQDWDKIIPEVAPQMVDMQGQPMSPQVPGEGQQMAQGLPPQMQGQPQVSPQMQGQSPQMPLQAPQVPPQMAPQMQNMVQAPQSGALSGQFQDPQIAQLAAQLFGGR